MRAVLPASRLATCEMSSGVFVAFYALLPVERRNWMYNPKPEFLWVLAADKTPLLHKHSPSCSNRFANRILKDFFFFGPHRPPLTVVLQTSWRGTDLKFGHLMALCCFGRAEEIKGSSSSWLELFVCACVCAHRPMFTLFVVIKSVKLQLKSRLWHERREVFSSCCWRFSRHGLSLSCLMFMYLKSKHVMQSCQVSRIIVCLGLFFADGVTKGVINIKISQALTPSLNCS